MKKKLLSEIRAETAEIILARISKEKKELAELYLDLSMKKLKDTRKIFHKKKDISQMLTIVSEKRSKI